MDISVTGEGNFDREVRNIMQEAVNSRLMQSVPDTLEFNAIEGEYRSNSTVQGPYLLSVSGTQSLGLYIFYLLFCYFAI